VDALAKPGDSVRTGSLLACIHAADPTDCAQAKSRLEGAFEIEAELPVREPLIFDTIYD